MTWLTWRLHRTEAAIGTLLFVGLIAVMLLAGESVSNAYESTQTDGCVDDQGIGCGERLADYFNLLARWNNLTTLIHGVPLAVAVLLAIPTLQELERGTHRLAWTQSISRRRWTLSRIGFAVGVATLVAAIWVTMASNWRASVLRGESSTFGRDSFDLSPAVLFGYALFAVALAFAAAVVVRRLIPVLALLAVGFIGTRLVTALVLRERYRAPVEETVPAASDVSQFTSYEDRWVIDESWLTRTGERISWDRVNQICVSDANGVFNETAYQQCQVDNGLHYFRAYHPASRFDQFQFIETALFLGLAAGMLAFAYWWLTRRSA